MLSEKRISVGTKVTVCKIVKPRRSRGGRMKRSGLFTAQEKTLMSHKTAQKKGKKSSGIPPLIAIKQAKSIHFMNKPCTFLMVCLFASLGGGGRQCVFGERALE